MDTSKDRACVICGAPLTGNARQRYCSPACRIAAFVIRRRRKRYPAAEAARRCAVCDVPISGRVDRRYCSGRCAERAYRGRHPELRRGPVTSACVMCGVVTTSSRAHRYCSQHCRERATAQRAAARDDGGDAVTERGPRSCIACGVRKPAAAFRLVRHTVTQRLHLRGVCLDCERAQRRDAARRRRERRRDDQADQPAAPLDAVIAAARAAYQARETRLGVYALVRAVFAIPPGEARW